MTDAAISSDGKRVAVRTYHEIAFYIRDSGGKLTPEPGTPPCEIGGLEPQGEGIDWWDHDTLVLTSERALASAGTITLVRCPRR